MQDTLNEILYEIRLNTTHLKNAMNRLREVHTEKVNISADLQLLKRAIEDFGKTLDLQTEAIAYLQKWVKEVKGMKQDGTP